MSPSKNYYDVLGVDKNAPIDEIKRKYRDLCKKYHPDINKAPGAEARMKEINEAYDALKDPKKRQYYDQFGTDQGAGGNSQQAWGQFRGTNAGFENLFGEDIGDILSNMFGTGQQKQHRRSFDEIVNQLFISQAGEDLRLTIDINLKEAICGTKKTTIIQEKTSCNVCQGRGFEKRSDVAVCRTCQGAGETMQQRNFMLFKSRCGNCNGLGIEVLHKCRQCHGKQFVQVPQTVEFTVDAGLHHPQIKIAGHGNGGVNGGKNGNLIIEFRLLNHEFVRYNPQRINELLIELPISVYDAICGVKQEFKFFNRSVTLKIHPGCQPNERIVLRGDSGLRVNSFGYGDLIFMIKIVIPAANKINHDLRSLTLNAQTQEQSLNRFLTTHFS